MFGGIARRYDLMNTIMTAGMHRRWRRAAVEAAGVSGGSRVIDLCSGTGDLAFALRDSVGPQGAVTGIDFSDRMLQVARAKASASGKEVDFRWGDATAIDFPADTYDAATVGFGVRNIPDIALAFREMRRVVRPGGSVVCLEITRPQSQPSKSFYRLWFDALVPALGRLVSRHDSAYSYLPSSVRRFPPADELAAIMESCGLRNVTYRLLAGGIIALHRGEA
jgi:demethylmenaquinone methyltransferase/2-methoxy-6-polyprenyl-1,4-benzoquinol methylase